MMSVYLFFNIFNGKTYVGKTNNVKGRCKRHFSSALKSNRRLFLFQYAIRKWGPDAWVVSVLGEFFSKQEARDAEIYWIAFYKSKNRDFGYNLTDGGEGTFGFHQVMSSETRQKMSNSHKGKKFSCEHKRNLSRSLKGRPKSAEAIRNMIIANTGRITSFQTKLLLGIKSQGSKNGNVKLSENDVFQIRSELDSITSQIERVKRFHELAEHFKTSVTCIRRIWTRQSWKFLKENNEN